MLQFVFRSILFILLFGLTITAFGQKQVDSLLHVYNDRSQPDSSRLLALRELAGDVYMQTDPDSCLHFAKLYEQLALEKQSTEDVANALHIQGIAWYFKGKAAEAIGSLKKSLEFRRPDEQDAQAASINVIGAVYMQQGNHAQAMVNYMECLKISEQINNNRGISGSSHNIGQIYSHQGDKQRALEYFKKSLDFKADNDLRGISSELDMLGSVYADMGQDSLALDYFYRALEMRRKTGELVGIGMSLGNIGQFHLQAKNLALAMDNLNQSLNAYEQAEDLMGISTASLNISRTHQLLNQFTLAESSGVKALKIATEIADARLVKESAQALSQTYRSLNRPLKALEMFELYITMRDSIDSEENQREVLNQEYKYQYEKEALSDSLEFAKRDAVMQERTEKQRLGLSALGVGLLLLLALAFSIYSGKKKSDELLLNILPAATAKELKEKGSTEAKLMDEVTVLFTDFKGFTAMSEQLAPKDLVQDIHECFSEFDRICEKYGVEKIKTIGDAYMAAGGLPLPNPTHAIDVVKAALEMVTVIENGKAKKIVAGKPYFEIRIGIHSGPVVAGIVGIRKFQYDIWGDTVNIASRMESSGEVGKVNISETTFELVKHQFTCIQRGAIEAKGKGKMEMYFVEAT